MHYYKLNIADWKSSTIHLSLEEEAIYFKLLNHYYDTEKPIPEDTSQLYRRLMLLDYEQIANSILHEYFILTDKGWEKEKCNEIIKAYQKNKNKNKLNGKKGGRPIGSKGCSIKPTGLINKTHSQPTGNPNQELLTTNYKPITNKDNKDIIRQKPNGLLTSSVDVINLWNVFASTHSLPQKRAAPDNLKNQINNISKKQKWKSDDWDTFLNILSASDLLMGKSTDWKMTLDWLAKPVNFSKALSGNYTS